MSVVSDTSCINYVVLIGEAEVLHQLYDRVIIPHAVLHELQSARTPEPVRNWMASRPAGLEVWSAPTAEDRGLEHLGRGERDAIAIAEQFGFTLLIDERDGRAEARRRNLRVTGLLGALRDAGERGLTDVGQAVARLRKTAFRLSPRLLDAFERSSGTT